MEAGRRSPRLAQTIVAALTLLCALATVLTVNITGGLVNLAMMSYEGIVQLAPALFLGIFWRRGTALAATASMIGGLLAAILFYLSNPISITWLGGLVPGVAGLMVNTLIYIALTVFKPNSRAEQQRIDQLFESVRLRTEAIQVPNKTEGVTS